MQHLKPVEHQLNQVDEFITNTITGIRKQCFTEHICSQCAHAVGMRFKFVCVRVCVSVRTEND